MIYTPGPWFMGKPSSAGSQRITVWGRGGEVRVADCRSSSTSLEGRRADARLIAAAPELLETLEELVAEFGICGLTEKARAVIAKVTGELQ